MDHRFTLNETQGQEHKLPCSHCSVETRHEVLTSVENVFENDFIYWEDWQIVQCQGCGTTSFRMVSRNTDDIDGNGDLIEQQTLYPSRVAGKRELRNRHLLPSRVKQIYQETYIALSNNARVLAGVGVRALVEAVCKEIEEQEEGKKKSILKDRINNLVAQGIVNQDDAKILHSLREIGNLAAHEVEPQCEDSLKIAFKVIENLLERVYIIPRMAQELPKPEDRLSSKRKIIYRNYTID